MISIVTHESVRTHPGWTIEQVHRVLDKLDDDGPTLVRLDPGFALDLAESLALRCTGLTVVPAQPNWLPMWEAYKRHHAERRLSHLLASCSDLARPHFLAADGEGRVSYLARDEYLAATADTHVVVYDGRDRGSVVRYLQLVLGAQPTILIDPVAQRVTLHKGDPCPTPTSLALVPTSSA